MNLVNHEADLKREQIIRKLDHFLDDFDFKEELAVLRYNQCFTVVPESKRELMENFQNWHPRVLLERVDDNLTILQGNLKAEEARQEQETVICIEREADFEDIIVDEGHDESQDTAMAAEEFYVTTVDEDEEVKIEVDETAISLKCGDTKEHRKWANEITKKCYSIQETADGIVPIWSCSLCGKAYKSAQALRLHLLAKHLGEKEHVVLPDDLREWIKNESRERRMLTDENKFGWACALCKFTCTSVITFRAHLIATHIEDRKLPVAPTSDKTLNYHQHQWIQSQICQLTDKIWKCLKCELEFKTEKILREHLVEHALTLTTDDFKEFKIRRSRSKKIKAEKLQWTCKECWFQFSAQRSFDSHMRLHDTLKELYPFTEIHHCKECKMFFRSSNDLTSHLEVDGHADGQTALVAAEGIALQKTILYKRLPIPQDASTGDSVCGHCGRIFDGEINCKSHLLIHHVNPLVCPKDSRQFVSMQPYICHLQKVHSDMFPKFLLCTHCKMSFDNIYERLAHMKQCDEKKFTCDHCEKKFSNKNYLNSHLKRELGLLRCSCSVCGKVVKAKDELKIHMRTHTKEV